MLSPTKDWNPLQAKLKELAKGEDQFAEFSKLCLLMHSKLHSNKVYGNNFQTFDDSLFEGLGEYRVRVTFPKLNSIVWNIWHIARIEDAVCNILILDDKQVFNNNWKSKMKVSISDTGNAMVLDEIDLFSKNIDFNVLQEYRIAVGKKTIEVINSLTFEDLNREFKSEQLTRLVTEGVVVNKEESMFLKDFWGRMTIARAIFMPLTRHQVVHFNNCFKIKNKKRI